MSTYVMCLVWVGDQKGRGREIGGGSPGLCMMVVNRVVVAAVTQLHQRM